MKDRLITLAGALLSAWLVAALLMPPGRPEPEISRPTSEDEGRHGLKGLRRWLEDNGVPTRGLHRRYSALEEIETLPARGNLLLVSLPPSTPGREEEFEALRAWVAAGNHLLLLTAYSDSPDWTEDGDWESAESLLSHFGVSFEMGEEDETPEQTADNEEETLDYSLPLSEMLAGLKKQRAVLEPVGPPHPLTEGVEQIEVNYYPAFDRRDWRLTSSGTATAPLALSLLAGPEKHSALWEMPYQQGRVWLSAYADPLSNIGLGLADNARLFGNLLALSLETGGEVIFDDYHFGLSALYDPKAFYADPRLHNTLWFLLAFWLIYLLGYSNRLAPPQPRPERIHAVDFIRATAGLFARRLSRQNVARGLFKHFFHEVYVLYHQPPSSEPPWRLLERLPAPRRADIARLRAAYQRLENGQTPELGQLSRLLHALRKAMS